MYKTSNPTLKNMHNYCCGEELADETKTASYVGVALKALLYVGLAIAAAVTAAVLLRVNTGLAGVLLALSVMGAFICSLVASFMPATCPVSGSLYAIFEGFAVGALSALFDAVYSGIVLAALYRRHKGGLPFQELYDFGFDCDLRNAAADFFGQYIF